SRARRLSSPCPGGTAARSIPGPSSHTLSSTRSPSRRAAIRISAPAGRAAATCLTLFWTSVWRANGGTGQASSSSGTSALARRRSPRRAFSISRYAWTTVTSSRSGTVWRPDESSEARSRSANSPRSRSARSGASGISPEIAVIALNRKCGCSRDSSEARRASAASRGADHGRADQRDCEPYRHRRPAHQEAGDDREERRADRGDREDLQHRSSTHPYWVRLGRGPCSRNPSVSTSRAHFRFHRRELIVVLPVYAWSTRLGLPRRRQVDIAKPRHLERFGRETPAHRHAARERRVELDADRDDTRCAGARRRRAGEFH